MKDKTVYRNNGMIGALLDEYEKAIAELIQVIQNVSKEQLVKIVDTETSDEDCRSIQTILTHIIESGYTYVIEIRKWLGESIDYKNKELLNTTDEYQVALKTMFQFNEMLFEDHPKLPMSEKDPNKKMTTRWGQNFDPQQLLAHAIVHVLKHRRQIARFKQRMGI